MDCEKNRPNSGLPMHQLKKDLSIFRSWSYFEEENFRMRWLRQNLIFSRTIIGMCFIDKFVVSYVSKISFAPPNYEIYELLI